MPSNTSRGKAKEALPITGLTPRNPRSEDVPLKKLLPPKVAARDTMDEVKMGELIDSIKEMGGILQPLVVEEEGEFFRIHAGHRRFIASTALQLETVPCRIWAPGTLRGEAAKAHENAFREDLNYAEEAIWFLALLDSDCDGDVDKLVTLVGRKRAYVEGRINLANGNGTVFAALKDGLITLGVAEELNRCKSRDTCLMLLDAAVKGGARAATVKQWRLQSEGFEAFNVDGVLSDVPPSPLPPNATESQMVCCICSKDDHPEQMQLFWIHWGCNRAVLEPLLERMGYVPAEKTEG